MLSKDQARLAINDLTSQKKPFLFIIDYSCENNIVQPLDEVDPSQILYDVHGTTNFSSKSKDKQTIFLRPEAVSFDEYKEAFDRVLTQIKFGNTYLANLTFETPVQTRSTLREIFAYSQAKYKLWYKDEFVVFSPEIFIQIKDDEVTSFPMKGTIDASIDNAREVLLNDKKEIAEHVTIVDLIRNDLSIYANSVSVDKFRYIDEVKTNEKTLLQVSSKISGKLKKDSKIGDLIFSLLPAGSISGAPKKKTLEILNEVENYNRGFYTGVFGIFDGTTLDSGVMIRFIEKREDGLFYKSGGGIHSLSEAKSEYQELIDKIYVPIY